MDRIIRGLLLLTFFFVTLNFSIRSYCRIQNNDTLSSGEYQNDSIVEDIIAIINNGPELDLNRKLAIESRMNDFPGKIIRRDTVTFFLQSALEMAYYEYVKEDEGLAKIRANNFLDNVQEKNPLKLPIRYYLMKFKGLSDLDMDATQKKSFFLTSLVSELPLTLNLNTYSDLFHALKANGVLYSSLNPLFEIGFIDKCNDNNREDILRLIDETWEPWETPEIDFPEIDYEAIEKELDLPFSRDSLEKELEKLKKDLAYMLIDAYGNLDVIDSLILCNQMDSIGVYMNNFQNLTFIRGELRPLIENSKKYENVIPVPWRMNFYDIWGISHSYLGEHEEAIRLFEEALDYVENDAMEAELNMNIALAVCETGDIETAISKLKKYEDILCKNGKRFHYLDALAYMVGHKDKVGALKLYEEADSVLEQTITHQTLYFKYGYQPYLTRHFVREAHLYDNDLFKWRNALRQARAYSGVDSYFDLFYGIPQGLYYAELGRYRNFLFDVEGAGEYYEKADRAFENLDSCDYRFRWLNDCFQDVIRYAPVKYGADEIIRRLQSKELSPLHNIWLCLNLAYQILQSGNPARIGVLNSFLRDNMAEAIIALPSYESKYLSVPLRDLQWNLMTDELITAETENLANLNLLRKGLSQSSKGLLEKNLSKINAEEYDGLVRLRRELNSAYAYEDSLKVKKLLPQILQKESELYYSVRDSINLGAFIGTTVESVGNQLTENEVAIDFSCSQKNDTVQIGAFIIQKEQPTAFVRLKNIPLAEDSLLTEELHDIWEPLMTFLENKRNIYFSPDGILLNLGIEFFPDPHGVPVIYAHNIHRVSHLREIKNGDIDINGEIALIGVSDHNSPIGEGETIYRGNWTDMPGVKNEIEDIDVVLDKFPHAVFFNDDATESKINELNGHNVSVLHFSTHGIYRDFNTLTQSSVDPSHFDYNIAKRTLKTDRQSLCGLVLRGGNISWKIPHILDDNDDILMDDEIENMNFPNLKLTVLSACSTALGELDSDGIQGLQRAFRIAGAKNIICSVRNVNDYWTQQFMILLYQNLAAGGSVYDSFRNTVRLLYEREPDKENVWSSFILIE